MDNEIYPLCEFFGGYGFVNAIPCDFDNDGMTDIDVPLKDAVKFKSITDNGADAIYTFSFVMPRMFRPRPTMRTEPTTTISVMVLPCCSRGATRLARQAMLP